MIKTTLKLVKDYKNVKKPCEKYINSCILFVKDYKISKSERKNYIITCKPQIICIQIPRTPQKPQTKKQYLYIDMLNLVGYHPYDFMTVKNIINIFPTSNNLYTIKRFNG